MSYSVGVFSDLGVEGFRVQVRTQGFGCPRNRSLRCGALLRGAVKMFEGMAAPISTPPLFIAVWWSLF